MIPSLTVTTPAAASSGGVPDGASGSRHLAVVPRNRGEDIHNILASIANGLTDLTAFVHDLAEVLGVDIPDCGATTSSTPVAQDEPKFSEDDVRRILYGC